MAYQWPGSQIAGHVLEGVCHDPTLSDRRPDGCACRPGGRCRPVPLAQENHINQQLLAAQVGDILRKACPAASARMLVVYGRLRELESYARAQGYTEAEVKAYLKSPADKARIRREAEAYLARAGAVAGDSDSYCRVARDEVRRGTLAGQLLRVSG